MDPGNDPGRDEYGLPPVDVEIPDDARDLDRDVQAYYRELRARRRHMRIRRVTGPLTRHGMLVPLVAACLAVTLLTGTLLTVLTGRRVPLLPSRGPISTGPPRMSPRTTGNATSRASARSTPPRGSGGGGQLPDAQVMVANRFVRLRSLAPAVLAWVPAPCSLACGTILHSLVRQTAQARVTIYFVGTSSAIGELPSLAGQAGLGYGRKVVYDTTDALGVYAPAGVTAIFAHTRASVGKLDVVRNLDSVPADPARTQLLSQRLALLAGSRTAAPGPAATASAAKGHEAAKGHGAPRR